MSRFYLADLLDNLQTNRHADNHFIGDTPAESMFRVYGGQILAQSLHAAISTVAMGRQIHSMHGYFLRGGDPNQAIDYRVEALRDGGSFSTRQVSAEQAGQLIFRASYSFQVPEMGLVHQCSMPQVIGPDKLQSEWDYWAAISDKYPGRTQYPPAHFHPIDLRAVAHRDIDAPKAQQPLQGYWVKTAESLPDVPMIHQIMLAYVSDMYLLGTALKAHPVNLITPNFQRASLDHSLWFHDDFRADQWLYYHMDSPKSGGGRGFNRGCFYSQDGRLVASSAQEGLIRLK